MTALAPAAPGRLGDDIAPQSLLAYLQQLQQWLGTRREELDAVDAAIQALPAPTPEKPGPNPRVLTGDLMLSLTLWQAVKSRLELLLATWDSGRVGQVERAAMTTLIHGRLDTTVARGVANQALAGMNMSLPEACRLSDALAGQLQNRLGLTGDTDAMATRLRALKASMERLRDQVRLEPPETFDAAHTRLEQLAGRLVELDGKLQRGGDIGGMIGPLEIDAAKFERDLIVTGAQRRTVRARAEEVSEQLAGLRLKEQAMTKLVAQAVALVTPAPKYAVPDVDALGPIPSEPAALEQYAHRLGQVNKAFAVVQAAYSKAIAEHDELTHRLAQATHDAATLGVADPAMAELARMAEAQLALRPTPMPVVTSLVDAYVNHVSLARTKGALR